MRSDPDGTIVRPRAAPDPDATVVRPRRGSAAERDPGPDPDATVILTLGPPPPPPPPRPDRPLPKAPPLALPAGFQLHEYRIDGVLGQGGFGITYLATDVNLHAPVAIKEYLPEEIAFRAGDRSVSPNASRHHDRYRAGMDSFLVEARTLASFRHGAIVRVARFFEAHRTAYMVLEYERGSPLKTWWPQHSSIGEKGLVELLLPLFDGLEVVHAAGVLHRDIKPDNIQVRAEDGRLVLLDFGSAGQTVAVTDQAAVVVTPGYAPIEQYGLGEQGPWTDVYALGATLYWCVTGHKPPDAEQRSVAPSCFEPAAQAARGRFGDAFLQAIDWALQSDPAARPRNVDQFRRALFAEHLSSLNLLEALRHGDTVPPGEEALALQEGRWQRARRLAGQGLRTLLRPPQWPLALKMTLAMVATALLPMLATGAYNLKGALATVSAAELRYVEQMAHSTSARVSQFITDSGHHARALGSDADFAAALQRPEAVALAALQDKLARLVQANPDVQRITLVDARGVALVSSQADLAGSRFTEERFFQEALLGRSQLHGLALGRQGGLPGLVIAEPVAGEGGAVLGVLVLRLRGSSVAAILDEVRHDSALTPFLIDRDGVVIHHLFEERVFSSLMPLTDAKQAEMRADQRFRRERVESLGETALAAAMVGAQRTGNVSYRSAVSGEHEIAGFAPVTAFDWVVGVSETRTDFEAKLDGLYRALLWSVVLAGLLFSGLALRFARGIVRPLRGLTAAANALKAGDFDSATVKVERRDEIGQLARTFNVMIDVLRQRERDRDRDRGRR